MGLINVTAGTALFVACGIGGVWLSGQTSPGSVFTAEQAAAGRQPQGHVHLAGDHLNMNAWMQGAFESARQTATAVHARAVAERATARV